MIIGNRIKTLRTQSHMTQRELAQKIGLTPKMISFYEKSERIPPADIIIKFVDIFNVSADYLLGLSNSPDAKEVIHGEQLSSEEKEIVDVYRNLNADGKRILLGKALDLKLSGVTAAPNKKKDVG